MIWGSLPVVEAECCKRKHVYFSLCEVEVGTTLNCVKIIFFTFITWQHEFGV